MLMGVEHTIFIADDHKVFREDLKGLIADNEGFRLVGEADNGEDAWEGIDRTKPEFVLLDINMPRGGGLDVVERMDRSGLAAHIILVTAYKEESLFNRAMDLGVEGYVLKDDVVHDLPQALSEVCEGTIYLSPAVSHFREKHGPMDTDDDSEDSKFDQMTPTELRVLRLMADSRDATFIAKRLAMTPENVQALQTRMAEKLSLEEDALLRFASQKRSDLKAFKLIPEDFD